MYRFNYEAAELMSNGLTDYLKLDDGQKIEVKSFKKQGFEQKFLKIKAVRIFIL